MHNLKDSQVKAAHSGKLSDGGGLFVVMNGPGKGKFIFRYSWQNRRPEMGLGTYPETTLKEARKRASHWRSIRAAGRDPIAVKEEERRARTAVIPTLHDMFEETFEKKKATLKEGGKAGRWESPLRLHILPKLGTYPVTEITQLDLERVLKPIWQNKPDVARKALNRVKQTLDHAAAKGFVVDMQLALKAKALLGEQRIVRKHHESMPWPEVPAFYQALGNSPAELALRFMILTGLRTKSVRYALKEHRLEDTLLALPGELMKNGKPFKSPLSKEAVKVLDLAAQFKGNKFLFPGRSKQGCLSENTIGKLMKARGLTFTPHGFRSSLRNWLGEETDAPWHICELMLSHVIGNAASQAYERTEYLEQRRALLERWAQFLTVLS